MSTSTRGTAAERRAFVAEGHGNAGLKTGFRNRCPIACESWANFRIPILVHVRDADSSCQLLDVVLLGLLF